MSSALVRQALELVDPEENVRGRSKKAKSSRASLGQELGRPYKNKRKQTQPKKRPCAEEAAAENIRKLLALSQRTTDPSITKKIVARCAAGKPVPQKAPAKKVEEKSILFPDDEPESLEPES